MKIKGVQLPVGIKSPGDQNDDQLATVMPLCVVWF